MFARNVEILVMLIVGAMCAVCCLQGCPPAELDSGLGVEVHMQLSSDTDAAAAGMTDTPQAPVPPTEPLQPKPDPLFSADADATPQPAAPGTEPADTPAAPAAGTPDTATDTAPAPTNDAAEPVDPLLQLPIGWPDDLRLQKWSTSTCGPCKAWDRTERHKLESVMLPDRDAETDPAARTLGITVVPYFQLVRDGQVVWNGRGYWSADAILRKAQDIGRPL